MSIIGITTCVDYSHYLAQGIVKWKNKLDKLIVLTSIRDVSTINLCRNLDINVECHTTDIFYENGALFNKGAALNAEVGEIIASGYIGWILLFDADIIPPDGFTQKLRHIRQGNIYGALRKINGTVCKEPEIAGFFQLFHSRDKNVTQLPHIPDQYYHAGNYDSEFQSRWPREKRIKLDIVCEHLGDTENWCGINNPTAMAALREQRRKGQKWQEETVTK